MEKSKFYYTGKMSFGSNTYKGKMTDNDDIIKDILKNNKNTLTISKAGSGKTHTNIFCIEDLIYQGEDIKVIFAVPTSSQAEQLAMSDEYKQFNIPYYTGDIKKAYNTHKKICVCVYDSIEKSFEFMGWAKDEKVLIIIDEAHKLVTDWGYRSKAIRKMTNISKNTRVLYMTATPTPLLNLLSIDKEFEIDAQIEFIDTIDSNNYKECFLYNYKGSKYGELLRIINSCKKHSTLKANKILIFNNDIKQNIAFEKALKKQYKGIKIAQLNSKDNNNPFINKIVNEGLLEDANIFFCTAILEQGTNIVNDEPITVIYSMDSVEPSYTKLLQSVARPRKPHHTCIIMRKHQNAQQEEEEQKEELSIEEIQQRLIDDIAFLNEVVRLNNKRGGNNKLNIEATRKIVEPIEGTNLDYYGCIKYNNDIGYFDIDKNKLALEKTKREDKEAFKIDEMHEAKIKECVNADKYSYITPPPPTEGLEEAYKEAIENIRATEDEKTKYGYQVIKSLEEEQYMGLIEFMRFGSHAQYNNLRVQDKEMIEELCKEYEKPVKMLLHFEALGLDIRDYIEGYIVDLDYIEKVARIEDNKKFNRDNEAGSIKGLKSKLSNRALFRKLADDYLQKELNKTIELILYKVYNPIKAKQLNDKQRQKLIEILKEFYTINLKKNGQIKISSLLK